MARRERSVTRPNYTADGKGRLTCPYCDIVVGQYTVGTYPIDDPIFARGAIIEPFHDAPCGLRCAGSDSKHWQELANGLAMHTGAHTCPVCKPRKCPQCAGSRTIISSLWDAIHKYQARNIDGIPEANQRALLIQIECPRCLASGYIPGLDA